MSRNKASSNVVEFEYELVRRTIINRILYTDRGLRRGLNHDIFGVGPDVEDLVNYALNGDRTYRQLKAKGRRSYACSMAADHRRRTITWIVQDMCSQREISFLNGIWTLKVSTTDDHRRVGDHPRRGLKYFNDHHFHGRPKRDRTRLPQFAAA